MLLTGDEIKKLGIVDPCVPKEQCALSYGLEPSGYTLRLSTEFSIPVSDVVLDPFDKNSTRFNFIDYIYEDPFVLMPQHFVLGKSIERLDLPNDITAIAFTKSSYARCGVFANITTIDAGFKGFLVIEIANLGKNPVYIHPNYGIAEVLFFRHKETEGYSGNYQNQNYIKV